MLSLSFVTYMITLGRRCYSIFLSWTRVTLGILEASKKWTVPIKNWGKALGYFALKHPEIAAFIKS